MSKLLKSPIMCTLIAIILLFGITAAIFMLREKPQNTDTSVQPSLIEQHSTEKALLTETLSLPPLSEQLSSDLRDCWIQRDSSYSSDSSHPGHLNKTFPTWTEAAVYLGFDPWNPFEASDQFQKMNYVGADYVDAEIGVLQHAMLRWGGNRNGSISQVTIQAGYAKKDARIIFSIDWVQRTSINNDSAGSENILIASLVPAQIAEYRGETNISKTIYFDVGSTYYTIQIISFDKEELESVYSDVLSLLSAYITKA